MSLWEVQSTDQPLHAPSEIVAAVLSNFALLVECGSCRQGLQPQLGSMVRTAVWKVLGDEFSVNHRVLHGRNCWGDFSTLVH